MSSEHRVIRSEPNRYYTMLPTSEAVGCESTTAGCFVNHFPTNSKSTPCLINAHALVNAMSIKLMSGYGEQRLRLEILQ